MYVETLRGVAASQSVIVTLLQAKLTYDEAPLSAKPICCRLLEV